MWYAAGAAVKLAASQAIPCAVLNPDVVPGQANLFLTRFVQAVCCQFEATAQYLGSADRTKLQVTGCPIREDIRSLPPRAEAAQRLSLDPNIRTLVVTGASQGAQTINEAIVTLFAGLKPRGWQILPSCWWISSATRGTGGTGWGR